MLNFERQEWTENTAELIDNEHETELDNHLGDNDLQSHEFRSYLQNISQLMSSIAIEKQLN